MAEPAFGQKAASQSGEGQAGAAARRGTGAARRERCAGSRARPQSRRRGGGRRLLSVFLPQSGSRRARQADSGARAARCFHRHLVVDLAAIPRVRAVHDGVPVRVHRAEDARLCRPSREHAARCGSALRTARHGVERRRRDAGDGQRQAGDDVALGARRRRARRRLGRGFERAPQDLSRSTSAAPAPTSALWSRAALPRPIRAARRSPVSRCSCR